MRVLFVEDAPDLADAVQRRLRLMGHAADWLADGREADALLTHHAFDLVVLDVGLPRMDGTEILANLRARRQDARAHAHGPGRHRGPRGRAR